MKVPVRSPGRISSNFSDCFIFASCNSSTNFQTINFTDTVYTISSLTTSVITLSSSTSVTGNKNIFKIQYIPVTDKVLGGDPFYKRIYNAGNVEGNPGYFDYCVQAKNYFNSSWSTGFVKPTYIGPLKPDPFNIDTNRPVVQIFRDPVDRFKSAVAFLQYH